jgi:hypothetical protein
MLKSFLAKLTKHIGALPIHMPALRGVLVDIGISIQTNFSNTCSS